MKRILGLRLLVLALLCVAPMFSALRADDSALYPYGLTVEMLSNPIGVDVATPRLAWKSRVTRTGYNDSQTAYQILAASSRAKLDADQGDLWDSGWCESSESIQIPYQGTPVPSASRAYWKVRVKDQNGAVSDWSAPATWSTGLAPSDWKGSWIAQPKSLREPVSLDGAMWIGGDDASAKKVEMRGDFQFPGDEQMYKEKKYAALIHYAGNVDFEIYINGARVGHSFGMVHSPDLLRTIDVSPYLRVGKNYLGAIVTAKDGTAPAILLKFEVREIVPVEEGMPGLHMLGKTVFETVTDKSWKIFPEPVKDWLLPDFDPAQQPNVTELYAADAGPWGKVRRFGEKWSPAFRKEFSTAAGKKVESAVLFISGLGFYEASLDGKKIGGRLLDPALTRYDRRVLYSTYDLTDRFQNSGTDHTFNVLLGHGWYDVRSIVTWNFDAAPWRGNPRLLAQLQIRYDDGTTDVIATDESWDCVTSPIVYDCIRQGEIVDGGFVQKTLGKAETIEAPGGVLSSSLFPGTMIVREFPAKSVTPGKKPGTWIVDLGRNIAGWCRVNMRGLPKGRIVRFIYSERLKDGEIERFDIERHFLEGSPAYYVGKIGQFQTDYYIAGGNEFETFEPRFSYNGFQYIEVKGLAEAPSPEDFTGCVISNGFPETGVIQTSDSLLNKIQAATLSSYRANFVDGYPTDCPQREKNGWTGDANLACEQAMYNWGNDAAYEKWIRDLRDEQMPDGNLPGIVPTGGWGYAWGNGPAWDSSLILIPWYLYVYKGDKDLLEKNYDAMKRYVDYMTSREDADHLVSHGLGDWCAFKNMPPVQVTSSGYYYVDARIVAAAAKLFGKEDDAAKYSALADRIRSDYVKHLINLDNGWCSDGSLAAQACAIHQGLTLALTPQQQDAVFARLLARMEEADNHFDCGIFGVKYLLRTLSEGGRTDLALRLLLQETQPCFADWINRGAGTLWEDWGEGASRNHIMFGDVSAWYYQYLAGIRLANAPYCAVADNVGAVAFKDFLVAPNCRQSDLKVPGREPLHHVEAQVETPYGLIISKWDRDPATGELTMHVYVPANTTATIEVPIDKGESVAVWSEVPQSVADSGEEVVRGGKAAVRYRVGSGGYTFTVH